MPEQAIKPVISVSQLRCIGCGKTALPDRFRCEHCRDLLEIIYPGWANAGPAGLDPSALRSLWLKRRASFEPPDQSGVWRFREILPEIAAEQIITIREGNTPVYELVHCAKSAGIKQLYAKHQYEPHRLVQRHRHDGSRVLCEASWLSLGCVCIDREYLGIHGSVRGTRRPSQPGAHPRRQDF